jgi:hypothetical protein
MPTAPPKPKLSDRVSAAFTGDDVDRLTKRRELKTRRTHLQKTAAAENERLTAEIQADNETIGAAEHFLKGAAVDDEWHAKHADLQSVKAGRNRRQADKAALQASLREIDEIGRRLRSESLANPKLWRELAFERGSVVMWNSRIKTLRRAVDALRLNVESMADETENDPDDQKANRRRVHAERDDLIDELHRCESELRATDERIARLTKEIADE